MNLTFDEDQRCIKEAAQRFFAGSAPVGEFRRLRDSGNPIGYDQLLWRQMVELGFPATTLAPEHGGLGLGYKALGAVFEESGRTLAASPLFATVVLGASVLQLCASEALQKDLLPRVAAGRYTLALGLQEGQEQRWEHVQCRATRDVDGFVLDGTKTAVLDGAIADDLIVLARTRGETGQRHGLSLFLLPRSAAGLARTPLAMADSRAAASLVLSSVRIGEQALMGREGEAWDVLERVADRARTMLAAEMLGGMVELFERTIAYLGTREQFGVKISSFQALRHRAAKMYTEIELTRSAVMAAMDALDEAAPDAAALACLAKCRANDTYRLVSNEAIQMHGGIGVTDELDLGLFLKRSRVAMQTFGDSRTLRNTFANLKGY